MLRLIPAPLHRRALKVAHSVRGCWRRAVKPRVDGCTMIASDIEGRLLLVRLSYGPDAWTLPGVSPRLIPPPGSVQASGP